jgi:hypothetical protein
VAPKEKNLPATKTAILDEKFWKHFARDIWEQKPLLLKNVKSDLLEIGDAEIFKLLVLYADRCRNLQNPEGFKFYIKGLKAYDEDVLQVLPLKKDKNLSGYHARMEALFSDYCLVCDELLKANEEKQSLLIDFTSKLYRHVGFPNRFSEMGLYLGNYKKTPFGVHVDACGVFSFPVAGTKKFRLWTADFVRKYPTLDRAFDYAKYKKDSQLMTLGPGDMSYWPSSAWHIAESDGSFSATWSLGVWVDKPHHETFSESLSRLLHEKLGEAGKLTATSFEKLHEASGEMKILPPAYAQSIQTLQGLSFTELHESFLKSWMQHISLQGFKNRPQANLKLTTNSCIRLRSDRSPILWQKSSTNKTKIFFSFGGISIEGSEPGGLLTLAKDLNKGASCLISDYLKGANRNENLKSLQSFASSGAFSLESR